MGDFFPPLSSCSWSVLFSIMRLSYLEDFNMRGNPLEGFSTICTKTLYSVLIPHINFTIYGQKHIQSLFKGFKVRKDPKRSPRVRDSKGVASLCCANDDVKGSEDQVVDASKRDLFCQISSAFCFCASLLRPLLGVGEENVMSRVSERRLSQLNAIKVAPTQA